MGFELFFLCRYLLSSKHLIVYGFLQHEQNCRIRGECAFRRIFPCKALYMAVSLPQIVLWSIYSQKFNFAIHLCLDHSFPFNLSSSFCLTHLLLSLYSSLYFACLPVSENLSLYSISHSVSLQSWLSPTEHPSADHLLPVWGGWVSALACCQPSAVPTRQAAWPHQGLQHL